MQTCANCETIEPTHKPERNKSPCGNSPFFISGPTPVPGPAPRSTSSPAIDHVIQGKTRPDGSVWTPADVIDRLPPGTIGTATPDDADEYIVTGSPIVNPGEINQLVDLADDESAVYVPKGR